MKFSPRSRRLAWCVAFLFVLMGGGVALMRLGRHESLPATGVSGASGRAIAVVTPSPIQTDDPIGATAGASRSALERLAYAQAWDRPLPAEMAAFRDWTNRYRAASSAARASLEAEGVALARARRSVMVAMIKTDPQRALAVTVPAVVRQILPASVLAELERRTAGTGDYGLRVAGSVLLGETPTTPAMRRVAFIDGVSYTAYVYGRREAQLSKEGASLHGVALEGQLALHESPLRVLEPGEIPAAAVDPTCPVSSLPVAPLAADKGVNLASFDVVEVDGRLREFCGGMNMLENYEQMLVAAESGDGPRVLPLSTHPNADGPPVPAAEKTTSNTVGVKQVLVLRVDTSDFPGEPLSVSAMQSAMDDTVRPNLEAYSYGLTSIVTTVSPTVYRLPRTGASYATTGDPDVLFANAVTAAAGDYNVADFDRVIVLHPRINAITGSKITYGGEALTVGGSKVLVNGGTNIGTVTHELGHCYGLLHSNLWQVTDGDPLSPAGTTVEYGDPFDMMADSAHAYLGPRDTRHHFNPWQKNRLGWLADSAVTTVTTSGTYRIYRFDSKTPSAAQPLALRIFRDGVRSYWVGYRQSFPTNSTLTNGACVVWGFNNLQQSQLLDLTTPGVGASDAGLAIGSTLSDPGYGITIKPVARGGSEPLQYLDIEVTVPPAPPNVITAWGRTNALFFTGNTGVPTSPVPETYVPFGLTNVQAVAAGELHALALKSDGTVVAWGDTVYNQTTVPAGVSGNAIAIAAGGSISGAVLRDGTVRVWGDVLGNVVTPPAGLTGVRQLAIGGSHSVGFCHALALKTDGTIVAWGDNTRGQATVPAGLTNVIAVAASDRLSVALKSDGTVVRWGTTFTGAIPFPAGLSGITAIATSGASEHTLASKLTAR